MIKPTIFIINFLFLLTSIHAQNLTGRNASIEKGVVIRSAITTQSKSTSKDFPLFNSVDDAETIIAGIMDIIGLQPNFKIRAAHVPNVEANIRHHKRYILYNPGFISEVNKATGDKWASIFILAHEIGHHLNGHTILGRNSRPETELEADQFAGFILCKMGATLEEAQLAMHFIASNQESKTHPAKIDRLGAIERGWDKAEAQMKDTVRN